MKLKDIEEFIINARVNTYASDDGKVDGVLDGSTQLEYHESDWLYRDVYYTGRNTFYGMETIFYKNKPVFGMSYYGNWGSMTEKDIDDILRGALVSNTRTRLYEKVDWQKDNFDYTCDPDFTDNISEIGGTEKILKNGDQVYIFYYAGSILTDIED